jgi:hypothetical protein
MIKASNSFVTAKGSMPLLHKITKPTSTKHKADNQGESHATKKFKTFHNSSKGAFKKMKVNLIDQTEERKNYIG